MEEFFGNLPATEQEETKRKLQTQFDSTFFEMFMHELLSRLGAKVELHPNAEGSTKRPDFSARFKSGKLVIIEAKLASDESESQRSRKSTLGRIYDAINEKVKSPYFWISLGPIESEERLPHPRKMVKFLNQMVRRLEAARAEVPDLGRGQLLPRSIYRGADHFTWEVTALAKAPELAGKPDVPTIGSYPGEARWGDTSKALQAAMATKAGKYGVLNTPFVIALNATSRWGNNRKEVVNALFGSAQDGLTPLLQPKKNKRVSAVLVTSVHPWSMHVAPLCLYHNPYATCPCQDFGWQMTEAFLMDGRVQWFEGSNAAELFRLQHWEGYSKDSEAR
jgi:hypothetical protein